MLQAANISCTGFDYRSKLPARKPSETASSQFVWPISHLDSPTGGPAEMRATPLTMRELKAVSHAAKLRSAGP
jgi:hypothetical protein